MAENIIENEQAILTRDVDELTPEQIRERIIRLGFGGDEQLYVQFCEKLKANLPPGSGVALRGSVVTNERHEDGTPFDAKGEGTSDLDVTLIGNEVRSLWKDDEYYIPALHTKPLGDKAPDIAAPELNALREELQAMVGRPVNMQATANIVLYARDILLGQRYYTIVDPEETTETSE